MISLTNGISIELPNGPTLIADGSSQTADHTIVSHAHTDHITTNHSSSIICSPETAALIETRTENPVKNYTSHSKAVSLLPAGHIIGSRAALIRAEQRILYTGDICTRDRFYLDGFTPPDADILIIESTYGLPTYRFPAQAQLEAQINEWITTNRDAPLFLFGYSLGRAQKLHYLAANHPGINTIYVDDTIHEINQTIMDTTNLTFNSERFEFSSTYGPGDVIILPTHYSRRDRLNALINSINGTKAGFSGWAITNSFQYRGNYDITFPLSDHCDFTELVNVVKTVDPDTVYTHHGFNTAFADYLSRELDYDARPLMKNQTTLDTFT